MVRRKLILGWRKWRRRARRFIVHDVLHADDPPHRLALGIALGIFFAFFPAFGAQMALVVLFAWLLRANKLVGTPIVWLTNPATVVPIYWSCYVVGIGLLGQESIGAAWWEELRRPPAGYLDALDFYWARVLEIAAPLLLGSVVLGLAAAYPTYLLAYYAIRAYRLRRWGQLTPPGNTHDVPSGS